MNITTTYKTNHNGTSQILAKGAGKQRTTNYDPAKSSEWNHGNAAGELLTSGKFDGLLISLTNERLDAMTHDSNDSGTRHTFTV